MNALTILEALAVRSNIYSLDDDNDDDCNDDDCNDGDCNDGVVVLMLIQTLSCGVAFPHLRP